MRTMADKKTCNETINQPFTLSTCDKPAEWICRVTRYLRGYRCGIHAKRYEKLEKL